MIALGRRSFSAVLAGAAGLLATRQRARAESALAAPIDADGPTIAVAGPPDSNAARWAALLHGPLAVRFGAPDALRLFYLGSRDGVTGTNMCDARALPDGRAALLFPGGAALSWLAGDSRVRFDPARLLPMLAAVSSGVLCTRQTASGYDVPGIAAGKPMRVGCDATVAPTLAVLMALDMLGADARPVVTSRGCIEAARRGEVDAVFAHGLDMQRHLDALAAAGLRPVYAVSFPRHGLAASAPQGLPDIASMLTSGRAADDPLLAAWRAVAAASLLEAVLALPRLCPGASLAGWRSACEDARAAADGDIRLPGNLRLLTGEDSAAAFDTVLAGGAAQSALHRWMAARLDWRPT